MLALEILSTSGAPDNYWCYAIELAEDLLNFRAVESLNWRTPFECCKGETPDISPLYQFFSLRKLGMQLLILTFNFQKIKIIQEFI